MQQANQTSSIRFYLRCLITVYAVQNVVQRRGKVRASATSRDLTENDHSEVEHSEAPQRHAGTALPLPFRASEAQSMLPPAEVCRMQTATTQATLVDNEGNLAIGHASSARSPTTPGKRKALNNQGQLSSGKLPRISGDGRAGKIIPREGRRGDVWSVSESPTPQSLVQHGLASRNQREDTCDSDRTYAPPPPAREETPGTETEIDADEVMADTQGQSCYQNYHM